MKIQFSLFLLGFTLVFLLTPLSLQAASPTASDSAQKKTLIPFGPVKASLSINKSSGQCATTSTNPDELKKSILDNFGISFVDNGWIWTPKLLQLACDKFNEIAKTKFFSALHNGAANGPFNSPVVIRASNSCIALGGDVPCRSGARLIDFVPRVQSWPDDLVKVIMLHEIAHDLQFQPEQFSHSMDHKVALNQEGYVTGYGNPSTCNLGTSPDGEDYAEMITYYLNPSASAQTIKCASGANPYAGGAHPVHHQVAQAILGDFP